MPVPYKQIRSVMQDRGVTNTDIARLLLLTRVSVSSRMNGHIPWRLPEVYQVMDYLEVPHEFAHILFPADIYSRKRLPESTKGGKAG